MAAFDMDAAMDRLVSMEIESLAAVITTVDAKKFYPWTQEAFPYWHNRITGYEPEHPSQDYIIHRYEVTGRLVVAHFTEGYRGEGMDKAYQYIAEVNDYFDNNPLMITAEYPTAFDDIDDASGVEIVQVIGPNAFANSGIGEMDIGVEFVFSLPFIVQAY